MKDLFPEYVHLSEQDYSRIWKQALFVFDTNVLLNLYRYRPDACNELFKVLEKLSERIWIPHHVALEFQRNRLIVIAEQNSYFSNVRKIVEKARENSFADLKNLQLQKRHSLIDPEPLITGFEELVDGFLTNLKRLKKRNRSPQLQIPSR
jgi:PIN like domain